MCLNFLMMDFDHVRYSKNKLFTKEKEQKFNTSSRIRGLHTHYLLSASLSQAEFSV